MSGSLLVADEFYCIAHDDRTGAPWLRPRVVGVGLAAGLLAELVLYGRIDIDGETVRVVDWDPPADRLAGEVLARLSGGVPRRRVREWLRSLADTAPALVARRLVDAGLWCRVERRRLVRTYVTHVPVEAQAVVWRAMRLGHLLGTGEQVGEPDIVLGRLVACTGLANIVWRWQPEYRTQANARLQALSGRLRPSLRLLLAEADAAVADAVLVPH